MKIYSCRFSSDCNIPAANGDHLRIRSHKQLSRMSQSILALHAYPRIFRSFGIQGKQECLPRTKVRLAVSAIVF